MAGIDYSEYAISHAHEDLRSSVSLGNIADMPYPDDSFDLVFGKEVIPHIPEGQLDRAIGEIMRVAKGPIFFEIQCGRTPRELEYMKLWDGTHKVSQTPEWWEDRFRRLGFEGDRHYKVLIPESD